MGHLLPPLHHMFHCCWFCRCMLVLDMPTSALGWQVTSCTAYLCEGQHLQSLLEIVQSDTEAKHTCSGSAVTSCLGWAPGREVQMPYCRTQKDKP